MVSLHVSGAQRIPGFPLVGALWNKAGVERWPQPHDVREEQRSRVPWENGGRIIKWCISGVNLGHTRGIPRAFEGLHRQGLTWKSLVRMAPSGLPQLGCLGEPRGVPNRKPNQSTSLMVVYLSNIFGTAVTVPWPEFWNGVQGDGESCTSPKRGILTGGLIKRNVYESDFRTKSSEVDLCWALDHSICQIKWFHHQNFVVPPSRIPMTSSTRSLIKHATSGLAHDY